MVVKFEVHIKYYKYITNNNISNIKQISKLLIRFSFYMFVKIVRCDFKSAYYFVHIVNIKIKLYVCLTTKIYNKILQSITKPCLAFSRLYIECSSRTLFKNIFKVCSIADRH